MYNTTTATATNISNKTSMYTNNDYENMLPYSEFSNPNSPDILRQTATRSKKQREIVVLGFRGVGKSSIVGRFVNHVFDKEYNPTIESTYRKRIQYGHESLTLTIHDTTGQDELTVFSARHYIGVHGYIVVYDVTSRHSFEMARYINDKILTTMMGSAEFIPRLLVGNKCDVNSRRQVSYEEGEQVAQEMGCDFLEVSAKTNKNVEESFHTLLSSIYEKEGWNNADTDNLSPAGACSVILQLIAFCNLIFGALQIVNGLSHPSKEYPSDEHIKNNWVSYLRVGVGLYVIIVSIGGWIAASKRRRDMLYGYAISLLIVFLVTLILGISLQKTLFQPEKGNAFGVIEWFVSLGLEFVGMILAYYNAMYDKADGSNTITGNIVSKLSDSSSGSNDNINKYGATTSARGNRRSNTNSYMYDNGNSKFDYYNNNNQNNNNGNGRRERNYRVDDRYNNNSNNGRGRDPYYF
jgi:Ras family protein